ncbi:MAG: PAS domain-containing protein [Rhodospirillaceae bacterium]|nr:PAS domain-containing protein [Rhodospirillales bacterium]
MTSVDVVASVLVVAPRGRDAATIADILRARGITVEVVATVAELASRMDESSGAALIAEEALSTGLSELDAVLVNQPPWSNIPVILLAEPYHAGRIAISLPGSLNWAMILPRPLTPEILVSSVGMTLASRQKQFQIKALLVAQQQRTSEVLEGIDDGYLAVNGRWRCVYVNQRAADLLSRRREDMVGENLLDILPHWATDSRQTQVQSVTLTGHPFAIEEQCPINSRWLDVRCGRSIDGLSFFFRDITPRKESEEHLHLVLNELSHRVKNTLAVIQAIADQTFKSGGDLDSILSAFKGRLLALADTHALLAETHWNSVDLGSVIEHSIGHMTGCNSNRVRTSGGAVQLNAKACLAIGMTMHELSTNAAKYGALSTDGGAVEVNWRLSDDALVIDWIEQVETRLTPPTRKGFGTRLIDQTIEYELGGEVTREYRPVGLHCVLTVPAASALAA